MWKLRDKDAEPDMYWRYKCLVSKKSIRNHFRAFSYEFIWRVCEKLLPNYIFPTETTVENQLWQLNKSNRSLSFSSLIFAFFSTKVRLNVVVGFLPCLWPALTVSACAGTWVLRPLSPPPPLPQPRPQDEGGPPPPPHQGRTLRLPAKATAT